MELYIEEDGTVWTPEQLDCELGGYLYRCAPIGMTPEEAIDNFWSEEMEGVPLDVVLPAIISMRRLHRTTVGIATDNPEETYVWEVECVVTGDPSWKHIRCDLDPDSEQFANWVAACGHAVIDKRENPTNP